MRRCMNVLNLQVEIELLTPNCRLQVEQSRALEGNSHVGDHRDEVVGIRSRFAEAVVVVVVAKHGDSLAATVEEIKSVSKISS
jgi:hypothetical protein